MAGAVDLWQLPSLVLASGMVAGLFSALVSSSHFHIGVAEHLEVEPALWLFGSSCIPR